MSTASFFTFEHRCLVCGMRLKLKIGEPRARPIQETHLRRHVREGYLERVGSGWVQVKAHEVGFIKSPYETKP